MENKELKSKIIEIINNGIIHGNDNFGIPTHETIENIANSLVKEGIVSDVNINDLIDGICGIYVQGKGVMQLYKEREIDELRHKLKIEEKISNKAISLLKESIDALCIENVVNCETCPAYAYCGGEGPQPIERKWKNLLREQVEKELKEKQNDC